jgi:stage II sporulation protein P
MQTKLKILKTRGVLSAGLFLLAVGFFVWSNVSAAPVHEPIFPPMLTSLAERALTYDMHSGAAQELYHVHAATPNTPRNTPRRIVPPPTPQQLENLLDFHYLTSQIFLVDRFTQMWPSDINIHEAIAADFTICTEAEGPQVLIFHTHATSEKFIDSTPGDYMTGIMGAGEYLANVLRENYGINVLHHLGHFDQPYHGRSYERMEPVIRQVLEDNPGIQVIIDLHRDGLPTGHTPLTTYVNGLPTARIMFFNGLSRGFRNGVVREHTHLPNPNQAENLQFSLQLQLAANYLHPGLARRVYLREFRYSLHMLPRSTLVEVGTQYSTLQEAKNAMHPLAEIIAAVVLAP